MSAFTSALRPYRGAVKAVIFDFAGTIVDHGSCAPVTAFQEVFRQKGVPIDAATARGPMGKNKRDHIIEILNAEHVQKAWAAAHNGAASTEKDIDDMYAAFTPIQVEVVKRHADPIPGALELFTALRARGIKIGGNSGYNLPIMESLFTALNPTGLKVDAYECAGPANGRPKPWMSTRVAEALDAFPLCSVIKVDDTLPGIIEGLNAGMWTVGVARSGNEFGLSLKEAEDLKTSSPAAYEARLNGARERMKAVGAHFVIDSVADLLPVIETINKAMSERGENPLM